MTPHLCGGTFFALVLQARKTRKKARDKQKGGTDSLSDKNVFAGLTEILTGEEFSAAGDTIAKCASQYKTCQAVSSMYIPFTDKAAVSAFDSAYKSKNPAIYSRMTEFVETYLNEAKCEWLVRALIETIVRDTSIADEELFDIDYSSSLRKDQLECISEITLQPFLISVLRYIVLYAPDAESGRPTFEAWFSQRGKKAEWKYTGHVGDSVAPMSISLADFNEDKEDGETDDYDQEEEEIPSGVPVVVEYTGVGPDLLPIRRSSIYMIDEDLLKDDDEEKPILEYGKFLKGATDYYIDKKTLLNPEKPTPFYDLYVCNDLKYHRIRITGVKDIEPDVILSEGTIQKLEAMSKYIIIQGTGGIGKSMYLTHLFLSCADDYEKTGRLPVLISLKDYKENTPGAVDLIWRSVKEYDADIAQSQIIKALEEKRLILLMDGLDEIQSSLREDFNSDLDGLIKSYPGNTIIVTSRPIYDFVSFSKFLLFDIQPLTKDQAVSLVRKLDFWNDTAKQDFIAALNNGLYYSHEQFASNPLLLTIMLMTYSSIGDVPGKMHVFYSKAYETMARLHDATKGSFRRPLHTKLSPEDFAKYFSEFCARTYIEEKLEFTDRSFSKYMDKVLKGSAAKEKGVTSKDFLDDLKDNLCIMYKEGEKYYFIHRSFQEYFAAVYFAYDYDDNLGQVGKFFDESGHRSRSDRTFDMLYDMIPEKVERFIFLPFLTELFEKCKEQGEDKEYWSYLLQQYPVIIHEEGEANGGVINIPVSFVLEKLLYDKKLYSRCDVDYIDWPSQVTDLDGKNWVRVYKEFADSAGFEKYPDPSKIPEEVLDYTEVVPEDEVPYEYDSYFGDPDAVGATIEVDIQHLLGSPAYFKSLLDFLSSSDFPLMEEFQNVKKYYSQLLVRTEKQKKSTRLFDD